MIPTTATTKKHNEAPSKEEESSAPAKSSDDGAKNKKSPPKAPAAQMKNLVNSPSKNNGEKMIQLYRKYKEVEAAKEEAEESSSSPSSPSKTDTPSWRYDFFQFTLPEIRLPGCILVDYNKFLPPLNLEPSLPSSAVSAILQLARLGCKMPLNNVDIDAFVGGSEVRKIFYNISKSFAYDIC